MYREPFSQGRGHLGLCIQAREITLPQAQVRDHLSQNVSDKCAFLERETNTLAGNLFTPVPGRYASDPIRALLDMLHDVEHAVKDLVDIPAVARGQTRRECTRLRQFLSRRARKIPDRNLRVVRFRLRVCLDRKRHAQRDLSSQGLKRNVPEL